jgi:hypothetical protein
MHLCLSRYLTMLEIEGREIGDEQLTNARPRVRALAIKRLEMIWDACEPHITGEIGKPDPRYIEAGIRVIDRIARLYRLDVPEGAQIGVILGANMDIRDSVLQKVMELEHRMDQGKPE